MDILKDLEKDCESRCQKFLKRYYRLIMKLSRRRLGENFDPMEILSEATIAFHRWSFYHSRSKRTKMPSSFSWFFNKRLDIYERNGGCCVKDDREWNPRGIPKVTMEMSFIQDIFLRLRLTGTVMIASLP